MVRWLCIEKMSSFYARIPFKQGVLISTGDSTQDYGSANVEVDGIVDETHLAHHIASNPAIDQVVEVLVQPQGGHGDTSIALTTSEVGPVGHDSYISNSRVDTVIDTSEAFHNRESSVVTASSSSLQQQQQVMNAQNVIPIGNANLSGLANILQNPEVLAAINAAAASNKFIVIGPVGMLSNTSTGTTNTASIGSTYSSAGNLNATSTESDSSTALCSAEAVTSASDTISGNQAIQLSGVGPVEPGTGACNVEMIAADTSQDSSAHIAGPANEAASGEVQSSVPSVIDQLTQSSNSDPKGNEEVEYAAATSEEAEVVSSQDTKMQNVISHHQNLEGEVSSSAGSNQSANGNGAVAEPEVDNTISSGNIRASEGGVFYAVQQSDGTSSTHPSNGQFIVTMKDQFVSSSSCTTSLAGESFMASNAMTGTGQSMVMVTADGQSYLTTMSVPDGLGNESDGQQIVLTPAEANNLHVSDGIAINSSVNMNSNEASCVLLTAHLPESASESDITPGQSSDTIAPHSIGLGDFTVTDSTTRTCAYSSSNIGGSAINFVANADSESSLEVSGSNNLQPDSMHSKEASTMESDSTVDSQANQADSIIQSSQVFVLASAVEEGEGAYPGASSGSGYEAQQSMFIDATGLIAASPNTAADSVVSGTENFVSSDLQKNDQMELEKTGVTSSRDLMDSTAEQTPMSDDSSQEKNDQDDSQVSTSLQI